LLRQAIKKGSPQTPRLLEARGVGRLRHPPLSAYYAPISPLGNGWRIVTHLRHVEGKMRTSNALSSGQRTVTGTGEQGERGRGGDNTANPVQISAHLDTPNRWTVRIVNNRQRGMLMTPLTYYPGWHCTIVGKPASLFRVNLANMGVVAHEGDSALVFTYRPASFRIGLYFGGGCWCALIAWTVLLCLKRPRT
jgi:hypothetical protein